MKLFLAQFEIELNRYMGKTTRTPAMRLVWAQDLDQAEQKLQMEFDFLEMGGDSQQITRLELIEAIQ